MRSLFSNYCITYNYSLFLRPVLYRKSIINSFSIKSWIAKELTECHQSLFKSYLLSTYPHSPTFYSFSKASLVKKLNSIPFLSYN